MDYEFKPEDRVRLTRAAVALYGGAWPHWIPQAQGGGTTGTVLFAGDRPHKPGASPRPYFVRWDNGVENSYRVEDLERAPDAAPNAALEAALEPPLESQEEAGPKIIPFNRR